MIETPIRIAAFATENDRMLAVLIEGVATSDEKGNAIDFRYQDAKKRVWRSLTPTLTDDTLHAAVKSVLDEWGNPSDIDAFALSTYGAIDLRQNVLARSPSDSEVFKTPEYFNFGQALRPLAKGALVVVDNDASSAALGECLWGVIQRARRGEDDSFAYILVSRGINAGIVLDGKLLPGEFHPEMGHWQPHRYRDEDGELDRYRGNCSIHTGCITGLAGLRAFEGRMAMGYSQDAAIDASAFYIAQLCGIVTWTFAPRRIVFGGLQMRQPTGPKLLNRIQAYYPDWVRGFPGYEQSEHTKNRLIVGKLDLSACAVGVAEVARRKMLPLHPLRDDNA